MEDAGSGWLDQGWIFTKMNNMFSCCKIFCFHPNLLDLCNSETFFTAVANLFALLFLLSVHILGIRKLSQKRGELFHIILEVGWRAFENALVKFKFQEFYWSPLKEHPYCAYIHQDPTIPLLSGTPALNVKCKNNVYGMFWPCQYGVSYVLRHTSWPKEVNVWAEDC